MVIAVIGLIGLTGLPGWLWADTVDRTINLAPSAQKSGAVPQALFGANIGYWSVVNGPTLAAAAQEAGLTVLRYHPGTYNDPHTVPGAINQWDFTAVDDFGAQRLGDFGRFLLATGAVGQIHFNYGAGSPAQAAALVAYLRVPTDAPQALLDMPLGSAVVESSILPPYTRTRDWRTVGFWANLRASEPLPVDDGFNKLRLGHPAPFPVMYFECGNEADYNFVPCLRYRLPGENSITHGATGYGGRRADARTYAEFYAAARALMQSVDPSIKVGASAGYFTQGGIDTDSPGVPYLFPGTSGTTRAWTPVVLTRLRELGVVPDFIIAHRYTQQTDFAWNNDYLLRGALRAYLAPGQGDLPRIHVTEINWAENESVPHTTTIQNAVNLARSYADALQSDVENLCWFTFTSGAKNYDPSSTTGWRKYHNWGLIADDPLAGQTPNPAALSWPGLFAGARFPVFHACALLKEFVRPGDAIYRADALSPANTNASEVKVFAAKRPTGEFSFLLLNQADAARTVRLTLNNADLAAYAGELAGFRYGKDQDEEQRLKAIATPPILTNNTRETITVTREGNVVACPLPPLSVTVLRLPLAPVAPVAPPVFQSPDTATGVRGAPFQHQVVVGGGPAQVAAESLPDALSFNAANRLISGTPASAGDFAIRLTANNTAGTAGQTVRLSVRDVAASEIYRQDFQAATPSAAGWWSYQGDGGVSGNLTIGTTGPAGARCLLHSVNVNAPPATYWYGGVGTTIAKPPGFSAQNLDEHHIELSLWTGGTGQKAFRVMVKTGPSSALTYRVTLQAGTWTMVSFSLADSENQGFDPAADQWDVIVSPVSGEWPLAMAEYGVAGVRLERRIPADTPAQAWRREHFGVIHPVGAAAWEATPAGDGISNLLKYALGGAPWSSGVGLLPSGSAVNHGGGTRLALTFQRVGDPQLIYEVWASEDLADWGSAPIWTSTGAQNQPGLLTVNDVESADARPRRFLRLKVRRP